MLIKALRSTAAEFVSMLNRNSSTRLVLRNVGTFCVCTFYVLCFLKTDKDYIFAETDNATAPPQPQRPHYKYPDFFRQLSESFQNLPEMRKIAPRDEYLKPGYEDPRLVDDKVDKDLDIQILKRGIDSLAELDAEPSNQGFSSKIVTRRTFRLPNGEIKTEEVVRNPDGTEQRSVFHTLPDGSQTTSEDLQSDQLSIGPYKSSQEEIKNWENHSHLMKGISDFINSLFK